MTPQSNPSQQLLQTWHADLDEASANTSAKDMGKCHESLTQENRYHDGDQQRTQPGPGGLSAEESTTSNTKPPPVPSKDSSYSENISSGNSSIQNNPQSNSSLQRQSQEFQQQQQPSCQTTSSPSLVAQERENFLMFVKILFKILDEAREPEVRSKAQRIVLECRRRSQMGDPNFIPLMDALERRLRQFVGEVKWRRAHLFLHHYITRRRNGPRPVASHPLRAMPIEATAGGSRD